jgi:hypothetical protein
MSASGWLFKKKSITVRGNINVKFTYTIFTTEEPHDTQAGEYHSIALFNKAHTVIERRSGSG